MNRRIFIGIDPGTIFSPWPRHSSATASASFAWGMASGFCIFVRTGFSSR